MTEIDRRISALGYKLYRHDGDSKFADYRNENTDTSVEIEWDDEDDNCKIFAQTISCDMDYYGHYCQRPACLSIRECNAFEAKINEMRG